jgi:hypothetical protein
MGQYVAPHCSLDLRFRRLLVLAATCVAGVPSGAKSLVLIIDDPDTFLYLVKRRGVYRRYNIATSATAIFAQLHCNRILICAATFERNLRISDTLHLHRRLSAVSDKINCTLTSCVVYQRIRTARKGALIGGILRRSGKGLDHLLL